MGSGTFWKTVVSKNHLQMISILFFYAFFTQRPELLGIVVACRGKPPQEFRCEALTTL